MEEKRLTVDVIPVVYALLSVFASCVMLLYYKRVREVSKEYAKAKAVLDDIILSFRSDFRRLQDQVVEISVESEKSSIGSLQILEDLKLRILGITAQLDSLANAERSLLGNYEELKRSIDSISSQRDAVAERLSELESLRRERRISGVAVAEPPVSIKREGALVPLRETELKVLEILAAEGERTAPQIRDRIGLTREHTARLMKSLYVRGYLERERDKMPYVYRLNREMAELMREETRGP